MVLVTTQDGGPPAYTSMENYTQQCQSEESQCFLVGNRPFFSPPAEPGTVVSQMPSTGNAGKGCGKDVQLP